MSVKSDIWIEEMANNGIISPFFPKQIRENCISYGLSSYGYDIRLSDEFKVFKGDDRALIDPKNLDGALFEDAKGEVCIIKPGSFILGRSIEYFRMPPDVMGSCVGKSTFARCGVIVNVTPLEPGWEGHLTISIINGSPSGVKLYAGEGIAQIIFYQGDGACRISYKDKKGKYDRQEKITLARI